MSCTTFLASRTTLTLAIFSSLVVFGLFFTIPSSLIYEIKARINQDMEVFGYLMAVLRCGKFIGHLLVLRFMPALSPGHSIAVHFGGMAVLLVGVAVTPVCAHWLTLAITWFITGASLASIETNVAFFNSTLNGPSAPRFTNIYYCLFSLGAALTPILAKVTKSHLPDTPTLGFVCGVVAVLGLVLMTFLALFLTLRHFRGISFSGPEGQEAGEVDVSTLPHSFTYPLLSGALVGLSSFLFMSGRVTLELFLLPFARHSGFSEHDADTLLQSLFLSSLVVRVVSVPTALLTTSTVRPLLLSNALILLSVAGLLVTRDHGGFGATLTTVSLAGAPLGLFQNSLMNWMQSRVRVNQRNSAPFFLCNCLAASVSPALVPHLIRGRGGEVSTPSYLVLVSVLMVLAVALSSLLIGLERGPCGSSHSSHSIHPARRTRTLSEESRWSGVHSLTSTTMM